MRSTKSTTNSKTTASSNVAKATSKPYKLDTLIKNYRTNGYDVVAEFLEDKAKRSKQTAFLYASGIKNLNRFVTQKFNDKYNVQTILPVLKSGQEDIYKLLKGFITYLQTETTNGHDLTPTSISLYVAGCRSYLQHNDIEIPPAKFKSRVTMPRIYREEQEAINANDIKEILHHCENRRLKAYLLVLASGGMRAMEALTLRESDVDFSGIDFADPNDTTEPALVRIRAEYTKTRVERRIFISNEAARYLHDWINWIYRDKSQDTTTRRITRQRTPNDLIFSKRIYTGVYPTGLYNRLLSEFQKVLELAHLSTRKENGVYKRRQVSFHSFRRFVKTTISNQTKNNSYSEWFLGHVDRYYVNKPDEVKRIYKDECMKYLTFLDYPTLEATGQKYEAELKHANKKIELLTAKIRQLEASKDARIKELEERRGSELEDILTRLANLENKK